MSGTMALLNSSLQLTNEDWQQLAFTYKDNYVVSRQDYYNYLAKDSLERMKPFGDESFDTADQISQLNMCRQSLQFGNLSGKARYTMNIPVQWIKINPAQQLTEEQREQRVGFRGFSGRSEFSYSYYWDNGKIKRNHEVFHVRKTQYDG